MTMTTPGSGSAAQSAFGAMFDAPMQAQQHAYVTIDFLRPDGDGIFSAEYDMCSKVGIGTINMNLADGYRIVKIAMTP
jgi:hypothetical protein